MKNYKIKPNFALIFVRKLVKYDDISVLLRTSSIPADINQFRSDTGKYFKRHSILFLVRQNIRIET